MLAAPLLSLMPLGISGPLWVQRVLQRRAEGAGWVGRSRASGEENEALQFGLVLVELALAPGVEWSHLAPATALGGPGRPQ